MKKQLLQSAKIIVLALVIGLGVNYMSAAWGTPTATPPNNNAPAPLNVTTSPQAKGAGTPIIGSLLDIKGVFFADHAGIPGHLSGNTASFVSLQHSDSTPQHVCADMVGNLVLCDVVTPPPAGNFQQVYVLDGTGKQRTSGDCLNCTDSQFITPPNVTSITVKLVGGGGGGGGAFIQQWGGSMFDCNGSGPVNQFLCQAVRTGGGGGGGAYSLYTALSTQASLAYTVDVGEGGAGGTSRTCTTGCGSGSTSTGTITAGTAGQASSVSGPNVNIKSDGGMGGNYSDSPYLSNSSPTGLSAGAGSGGTGGAGNVTPGSSGLSGTSMIIIGNDGGGADILWQQPSGAYGTGGSAGSSLGASFCAQAGKGGSGAGGGVEIVYTSPNTFPTGGTGCPGKIIFEWTI